MTRQARRIYRELTDDERRRIEEGRRLVADELPELIRRDQMQKDASKGDSLSAELRRAIHRSDLTLKEITQQCGITAITLDEFLTGEGTLASDVLDRLTKLLGLKLISVESREEVEPKPALEGTK
jgi:hypothetical protein